MSEHYIQLKQLTIDNVRAMVDNLSRIDEDPYIAVYDILVDHARDAAHRQDLTGIVAVAHMVYGWMPTILDVDLEIVDPSSFWQHVGSTELNDNLELSFLDVSRKAINNSMVGASKLLHFVAPDRYAIWDSRIYKALTGKVGYGYRLNDEKLYAVYVRCLHELSNKSDDIAQIRQMLVDKGYITEQASTLRALEVTLFSSSR